MRGLDEFDANEEGHQTGNRTSTSIRSIAFAERDVLTERMDVQGAGANVGNVF